MFLNETKCFASLLNGLLFKLGFQFVYGVDSCGKASGLALFWRDSVPIRILSSSPNHIVAEIGGLGNVDHW